MAKEHIEDKEKMTTIMKNLEKASDNDAPMFATNLMFAYMLYARFNGCACTRYIGV